MDLFDHRRFLLGAACSDDGQCGANQFCLHPTFSKATGTCTACWRCCLFPGVYGSCPDRCGCNVGATCETRDGCGSGLFCSVADMWSMPTCQRCESCTSNAYELHGSCGAACASGDMSGAASLPALSPQRFVLLSFLAAEISNQGAPVPSVLLARELAAWLATQGVTGPAANLTLSRMLATAAGTGAAAGDWSPGQDQTDAAPPAAQGAAYADVRADNGGGAGVPVLERGFVSTHDWMSLVSSSTSRALMCPAYDPALPPLMQPRTVAPGCFCNATADAASFRCPAGSRCSPSSHTGLETEALEAPTGQLLRAVCVVCGQGQYCPEGTYVQDETDQSSLDCPPGYFCPTPATMSPCPPGSFCGARSSEAISCNYEELLVSDPYRLLPSEPESVIKRLRDRRDPLRGNYCPAKATRPNELCSAGSYCPNVSAQLPCPRGHFCKAQSTAPWRCAPLTPCPGGTAVPRMSFMALLIAGLVLLGLPLIHLALTRLDNSLVMEDAERGGGGGSSRDPWGSVAGRATFRHLLKSMRLPSMANPLETKYRGFGSVSPAVTLEFTALGLRLRQRNGQARTEVLKGVSGSFSPRRLNAILGPSGCGKTTFLNVLCGKTSSGQLMGQVRVNGEDIPMERLKKIMGFVPQDDILHEDLTVRENLNYSARLRLQPDVATHRRRDLVADALEALGLGGVQHYRVGSVERRGISGGQRKRVNIGLELVAMPSLLLLDEPTSGLDATSSADILSSLSDMAGLGMNVIMVIHQPRFSSFLMFDQVLLLGGGGRTVYLGSPSAAMLYFTKYLGYRFPERENPGDILMDIIAGKLPCAGDPKLKGSQQLVERWEGGGMAWVETLEALNPTMTTKMSDVDPAILTAIDEEFDLLDHEGCGTINAGQLVQLFASLGQDISLEDAVLLIRKLHASKPASARSAGGGSATSGAASVAGLLISKAQLLDAFQGVREQAGGGGGAGGPQRNAAEKFYASQFVLPELPEEASASASDGSSSRRGMPPHQSSPSFSAAVARKLGGLRVACPETLLSGDSATDLDLDSDSYSPMYGKSSPSPGLSPRGGAAVDGAGSSPGSAPVVESMLRRNTLSPIGAGFGAGKSHGGGGGGEDRAMRGAALPPGMDAGSGGGAAAAAATSGTAVCGVADVDDSGELLVFPANRRAQQQQEEEERARRRQERWRRRQQRLQREIKTVAEGEGSGDDGSGEEAEGHAGGARDSALDFADDDGIFLQPLGAAAAGGGGAAAAASAVGADGAGAQLSVAPGLVAGSLAAMEALSRADVPLPPLPRRAATATAAAAAAAGLPNDRHAPSRSDRRGTAYTDIAAYVDAYNEMAVEQSAAASGAAGASSRGGRGSRVLRAGRASRVSRVGKRSHHRGSVAVAAAAAAAAAAGRASVAAGGGGVGEVDVWAPRAPPSAARPSSAAVSFRQHGAVAASPAPMRPEPHGNADGRVGVGAAGLESSFTGIAPSFSTAALPPLLRQLVLSAGSGTAVREVGAGPVAEGTEEETADGGGDARSAGALTPPPAAMAAPPAMEGSPLDAPLPSLTYQGMARSPAALHDTGTIAAGTTSEWPSAPALHARSSRSDSGAATGGTGIPPVYAAPAFSLTVLPPPPPMAEAPMATTPRRPPSLPGYTTNPSTGSAGALPHVGGTPPPSPPLHYSGRITPPSPPWYGERTSPPSPLHYSDRATPTSPRQRAWRQPTRLAVMTNRSSGVPSSSPPAVSRAHTADGSYASARATGYFAGGVASGAGIVSPARSPVGDSVSPRPAALDFSGGGSGYHPRSAAAATAEAYSSHLAAALGADAAEDAREGRGGSRSPGRVPGVRGGVSASGASHESGGAPGESGHEGRIRRASMGSLPGAGRKPRRQSWLQSQMSTRSLGLNGSDGSPTSSPAASGGIRKHKKDTLYVNSLLSNALVGAWAATQSVTAGRGNMSGSVARLARPPPSPVSCGGTTFDGGLSGAPSPTRRGAGLVAALRGGVSGGGSSTTMPLGLTAKVPSCSGGLGFNGYLSARLALEAALATRQGQSFSRQFVFLLRRGCVKWVRSFWPMRALDAVLQLAAAFVIGLVHGTGWGVTSVPSNIVMCMVCLGVLSCVTHLRTFSQNRVLLWRESGSGMSLPAYFLAQNAIDWVWVLLAPAISLGPYYYLTLPRMAFGELYAVGLCVCWWASGMAYLVASLLPPQSVLMAGVFISLICGAFLHGLSPTLASARGSFVEGILGLSYNRWAMEIASLNELKYYQDDMRNTLISMSRGIGLCGVDQLLVDDGNDSISAAEAISFLRVQYNFNMSYCDRYKTVGYGALAALGLGFRLLAFLFLRHSCVRRR